MCLIEFAPSVLEGFAKFFSLALPYNQRTCQGEPIRTLSEQKLLEHWVFSKTFTFLPFSFRWVTAVLIVYGNTWHIDVNLMIDMLHKCIQVPMPVNKIYFILTKENVKNSFKQLCPVNFGECLNVINLLESLPHCNCQKNDNSQQK